MITTRERATLAECASGLSSGTDTPLVELFRGILPIDQRHVVFTNQGKSAFEQIVLAAKLQCRKILLPAFFPDDFVGLFLKYKITPVFVDVDPRTYHLNLDAITPEQLADAGAMIVLHTFGLPIDGPRYRAFCDAHGLVLIEDCARALGAARNGALVGSFGHYALYSLPKVSPVREGGIALSERPMATKLAAAKLGVFGALHALTLVRFPFTGLLEAPIYSLLADTPVYPREVGNYRPRPARELDDLGQKILRGFMPHYRAGLEVKRACALRMRQALEPEGFTFQADDGTHIYTAVSVAPPAGVDSDALQAFLKRRGIKASAMWRGSLGTSAFARRIWNIRREDTPVAVRLSARLLQLPANRFQTPRETARIIATCTRFLSSVGSGAPATAGESAGGNVAEHARR